MAKNLKFVKLQSYEGSHTRSRSDAKQLSTLLRSSVSGEYKHKNWSGIKTAHLCHFYLISFVLCVL